MIKSDTFWRAQFWPWCYWSAFIGCGYCSNLCALFPADSW